MQTAPAAELHTCFLSYSRADEEFAVRLANDLQRLGVAMWVDRFNIRPSEHWDRAIERAIRACQKMVVILSPRSVASENVADEISLAIDAGKSVIPLMIEPCSLPLRLTRRHLIDVAAGYDAALRQCFAEIDNGETPASGNIEVSQISIAMRSPEDITVAKQELLPIIGPIANLLVDRVASAAVSLDGMYGELATHIPCDADRERFVTSPAHHHDQKLNKEPPAVASADPGHQPIARDEVERVAKVLTSYVGPIAAILARKESLAAGSVKDLLRRLAAKLPCERDRDDFLKEVGVAVAAKGDSLAFPAPGNRL
jgi:hypothetical protein